MQYAPTSPIALDSSIFSRNEERSTNYAARSPCRGVSHTPGLPTPIQRQDGTQPTCEAFRNGSHSFVLASTRTAVCLALWQSTPITCMPTPSLRDRLPYHGERGGQDSFGSGRPAPIRSRPPSPLISVQRRQARRQASHATHFVSQPLHAAPIVTKSHFERAREKSPPRRAASAGTGDGLARRLAKQPNPTDATIRDDVDPRVRDRAEVDDLIIERVDRVGFQLLLRQQHWPEHALGDE